MYDGAEDKLRWDHISAGVGEGHIQENLMSKRMKRSEDLNCPPRFSLDDLTLVVDDWPWLKLRFHVPPDSLTGYQAEANWIRLAARVKKAIREVLETKDKCLGFIVVPQYSPRKGMDDFCLAAYISRVWFDREDEPLIDKWLTFPKDKQRELLPAFYWQQPLEITNEQLNDLDTYWQAALKLLKCRVTDKKLVVRLSKKLDRPCKCITHYNKACRKWAFEQLEGIRLQPCGDCIGVKFTDGKSKTASDYLVLGRILHSRLAPRIPRRFGFFAKRDEAFSHVLNGTIDHKFNLTDLKIRSKAARRQLQHIRPPSKK